MRSAAAWTPGRRRAVVILLGLLLQLAIALAHGGPGATRLIGDELRYHEAALGISAGNPPAPNFVWPPLAEWILGGLYALFGPTRGPHFVLQVLLLIGCALFLERVVVQAGLGSAAGTLAASYLLLDPQVAAFAQYLWPEVPHLFFMLGAAALLLASGRLTPGRALGAGVLLGLALLTRSLLLPLVTAFLVAAWRGRSGDEAPGWAATRRTIAFLIGVCAVTLPVSSWNSLRWGTFGISQSGPFNLWVGLSEPEGHADYDGYVYQEMQTYFASSTVPAERNALALGKAAALVGDHGIVRVLRAQLGKQPKRLLDKDSYFTDRLPGGRFDPGRSPTALSRALSAYAYLLYGSLLVASAIGIFVFPWRSAFRVSLPAVLLLGFNLGLLLFLHVKTRYRIAFLPALVFFACAALATWSGHLPAASRARALCGLGVGVGLLVLASV